MSKARDLADFGSNPDEQTSIITVTVAGGKFVIDGTSQQTITMAASGVYKFDQSDSSNASHPLKISTTSDGTHGGGSAITVDFVAVGTAGSAGAYVTYTIQQDGADNYFYYCGNHSGMGGSIRKSGNPTAAEILTSIKTVDGTGSGLDADTLDGVEAAALMPLSGGTMTGNLAYGDNVKATFGSGDLQIFHDGSNSYVSDTGTGDIIIKGDMVRLQDSAGGNLLVADANDAVKLYYGYQQKLTTTATGVDVTGTVQADQFNNDEALPDIRPSLLLDFANSKTLDPRITFTRGSTATYWDGKTTAKAEENLLKYSQDFTNTWLTGNVTATGNNATAPDGTTSADKIQAGTNTNQFYFVYQRVAAQVSTVYTATIYFKAGTNDYARFDVQQRNGGSYVDTVSYIGVNLTNGATIVSGGSGGSKTFTVTDVGSGWYRATATFTSSASGFDEFEVEALLANSSGDTQHSISGSKDIFVWGAQLEQRSSATAYTPTTSAPIVKYQPVLQTAASGAARFDHDPVTGESKGLLIEEARTNLIPYSHDLTHSGWTKTRASITSNTIVGPDGVLAADKLVENTDNNSHLIMTDDYGAVTSGTTYTGSVYAKAGGRSNIRVAGANTSTWAAKTDFNLSNGTITTSHNGSATITDVGNGWYRCTITGLAGASATTNFTINVMSNTTSTSYTGDGFSGVYLWGAQVEAGSFATSYIATAGSTATRAADAAQVQNFDFNDGEGTVYCEGSIKFSTSAQSYARLWEITQDADANSRFNIFMNESGSDLNMGFVTQGTVYGGPTLDGSYTSGANVKTVVGYKLGENADVAEGGTLSQGSTPWTTTGTSRNRLYLGSASATSAWSNSYVRKFAYYSKLLSNATLQAMTTE